MVQGPMFNRNLLHYSCCLILLPAVCLIASCSTFRYETRPGTTAVASWYGTEFQGRPTASGERFDMHGMTCAHKELPFGTILRVTLISTGKSVKCTVNDRGPFIAGRDLDLSYGAAKTIGLTGPGTGTVRLEYLGRNTAYIKEVKYASENGPYTIQVGAFREQANAQHIKSGLDLKYKTVHITETTLNNVIFYRVRIGKFQKKKTAYGLAKTLAQEGYSPLIMHHDEHI